MGVSLEITKCAESQAFRPSIRSVAAPCYPPVSAKCFSEKLAGLLGICLGSFLKNNNKSIYSEGFTTTSFFIKKKDWRSARYCPFEMTFR
jgi:hypothetical protein